MRKMLLFISGFVYCFSHDLVGQDRPLFSGTYDQIQFVDLINDIEAQYGLKFYFSPRQDSIKISLDFKGINLSELLDQITSVTNVNFLVKNNKTIIATDQFVISQKLASELFDLSLRAEISLEKNQSSVLDNISESGNNELEEIPEDKIIEIGAFSDRANGASAIISGYVKEADTGEPVVGASIYTKNPFTGTATDVFGYFSIRLPKGEFDLFLNSVGKKPLRKRIKLWSDGVLNVDLTNDIISLKEIVVTGETDNVESLQTGLSKINIENIKQLPSIMGEADIMKIALNLPGVQTVGEGAAGFNVRGGRADQNLVLLNDVPVYNTSHVFGFISVFNPDLLSGADLYKSGIGANYGGRISSVFDVAMKDGNKKRFSFKGGISPITAKIAVEGPIKKEISSYVVGVRSTYSDWVFTVLDDPALRNSTASFYDIAGKVNNKIDDDNDLVVAAYLSNDKFRLNSDSLYDYSSSNASLKWRHTFSNQLNATFSLSFANYNYNASSDANPVEAFDMSYFINHYSIKSEFNYLTKQNITFKFGMTSILYNLQPGRKTKLGIASLIVPIDLMEEKGIESAIYIGSEFDVSKRLSIYTGFRLSMFNSLGPGTSFVYQPSSPKELEFVTDTVSFSNNQLIKTYIGPEPRFSARYKLRDDLSIKLSYDRMYQYVHVLSNTVSISPIDTWRLSGASIKPQTGNQYSVGLYKKFYGTSLELSLEGYFKNTNNILEYKDGAELLLNEALETDVINARGRSYGVEFLLKKNSGKFTGWFSYTFSRSLVQANGAFPVEQINSGEFFPSNFDKPHAALFVGNYKFNRRLNLSMNLNYSTGRPSTFPLSTFKIKNQTVLQYTDRNQFRIPDYFRVDVAINFDGNHKVHKKIHGSWSLSVYNLLGRANAYSVFFKSENDRINGYKLSVFSEAIPTITYHFKLK